MLHVRAGTEGEPKDHLLPIRREISLQGQLNTGHSQPLMTRGFPPQPSLGLEVRNRRQLLERLKENDHKGLGGILMSEIREALHSPEKAMAVSGAPLE